MPGETKGVPRTRGNTGVDQCESVVFLDNITIYGE